ncbi:MAG: hypothetical protein EHM90_02220 [Chloroflexi bacterium]|nr:MAG: hypothetical protein EHM90_02220 [Chloroflexota bacterium]
MSGAAPLVRTLEIDVPAAGAAVAQDTIIGEAPFAGEVTAVSVISEGAVIAHATNFRTLRVLNKGQAGAGSTVVASLALDTPTTDDLAAKDEKSIPLSGVADATDVVEGDVLILDETVAASGLAHTGLLVKVDISRA